MRQNAASFAARVLAIFREDSLARVYPEAVRVSSSSLSLSISLSLYLALAFFFSLEKLPTQRLSTVRATPRINEAARPLQRQFRMVSPGRRPPDEEGVVHSTARLVTYPTVYPKLCPTRSARSRFLARLKPTEPRSTFGLESVQTPWGHRCTVTQLDATGVIGDR